MANLWRRRIVLGAGQEPLRHRSARDTRLRLQLPVSVQASAAAHARGRRAKTKAPPKRGLSHADGAMPSGAGLTGRR
ncbi:hypothetical protein EMIT0158MI4_160119 [Burkholderia ambifaria]